MNKVLYFNDLFSIYKGLLTQKEQEIFSLYYEENLSLSEIAEVKKISRSAVGSKIKIVEKKLETYENCIGKYALYKKIRNFMEEEKGSWKEKLEHLLEEN